MGIISVNRTKIVCEGNIPEATIKEMASKLDLHGFMISVTSNFIADENKTVIRINPYVTEIGHLRHENGKTVLEGYRFRILTTELPMGVNVIEDVWVPHRKRAKKLTGREGLASWIALCLVTPKDIIEGELPIELDFNCDNRCADGEVDKDKIQYETLHDALTFMCDFFTDYCENANSSVYATARILDEMSSELAVMLDSYDLDLVQQKFTSLGLRYVDPSLLGATAN